MSVKKASGNACLFIYILLFEYNNETALKIPPYAIQNNQIPPNDIAYYCAINRENSIPISLGSILSKFAPLR